MIWLTPCIVHKLTYLILNELETSTKLYIYRNTLIDNTTVDIENKTFMWRDIIGFLEFLVIKDPNLPECH